MRVLESLNQPCARFLEGQIGSVQAEIQIQVIHSPLLSIQTKPLRWGCHILFVFFVIVKDPGFLSARPRHINPTSYVVFDKSVIKEATLKTVYLILGSISLPQRLLQTGLGSQ